MRYFILLFAVVIVASIFPNNFLSVLAYVAIALYSVFLATSLIQKAAPQMRRQTLITSSVAVFVALGAGAFFYFR